MGGKRQLKRAEEAVTRHQIGHNLARSLLEAALSLVRQQEAAGQAQDVPTEGDVPPQGGRRRPKKNDGTGFST